MQEIGAFDAKTHFSKLLNKVEQGESIAITRHGIPIAILTPITTHQAEERTELLKEFYKWRKGIRWDKEMNTKDAIKEGRR